MLLTYFGYETFSAVLFSKKPSKRRLCCVFEREIQTTMPFSLVADVVMVWQRHLMGTESVSSQLERRDTKPTPLHSLEQIQY